MEYKLIKEYPGSPKLGTKISFVPKTNFTNAYYSSTCYCTSIENIENHPEFWELIVEKDYEILATIIENDLKQSISKIKRLSDGEIFTIGDKVNCTKSDLGRSLDLTGFKIINDEIRFGLRDLGYYHMNTIISLKKLLFKTEDGVNIYEHDKFYIVNIDSILLDEIDDEWKPILSCIDNKNQLTNDFPSDNQKFFSIKEKAEEYILMNKPCLSLSDVASIYVSANKPITDTTSYSAQNRKIQDLVRLKIQQSV